MNHDRLRRVFPASSVATLFVLAAACGGCSSSSGSPATTGDVDAAAPGNDSGMTTNPDSGMTANPDSSTPGNPDSSMTANPDGGGLSSAMAKKVVAGFQHSCALTTAGAVRCWGYTDHGQLGNGVSDSTPLSTAVQVMGLTSGVVDIATSNNHTCAITSTGGVKCWGANDQGQLGNGDNTMTDSAVPVDVMGLTGVTAISAGQSHSCALAQGVVMCWGVNDEDQLGVDGPANSTTPTMVTTAAGTKSVSAGFEHTCIVTSANGAQCWGGNTFGELGQGAPGGSVVAATDVMGLTSGVAAVAAGYNQTCALTTAGGLECWGRNDEGEVGNNMSGVSVESDAPSNVQGVSSGATSISVGEQFTCAVIGGAAKCWGDGSDGALGNSADNESDVPSQVTGLTTGVTQISAGGSHACAVLSSGAVKCWGSNSGGQLGDGKDGSQNVENESNVPVAVLSLP